ncbi:MAG: hypothetical protein ACRDU9_02510 [Acidimicrobiia bacterium]
MPRELRVHGVSGTPPRDILYTDPITRTPASVATKIYMRPKVDAGYDTVAFHWANLTSGSRITALWILLAPFALANAAGWMAGWRRSPLSPVDTPTSPEPWHVLIGRMAVRAAGLAITALFVVQAMTATVVLPLAWLEQSGRIDWGPIDVSFGWLTPRLAMTILVGSVGVLVYWLVAFVSTKSHFDEVADVSVTDLILDPSGDTMRAAREDDMGFTEASSQTEDPAGALIMDARLWTVHPMLHRLRRLHFGIGFVGIGVIVLVVTEQIAIGVGLAVILVFAFHWAWMTTYRPEERWVWVYTSWIPIGSLAVFVSAIGSIWFTQSSRWNVEAVHSLTFGIAAILGVFVAMSLAAGPLSAGALVLATFFGAVLGTTIGLLIDKALHTDVLIEKGVGWVAVGMLALLVWLAVVAAVLSLFGHEDPERGATSPLPEGWSSKVLVLIRRVALEARVLFYAAGVFGLASFVYALRAVWGYGRDQVDRPSGFWETLLAGLDPAALDQFPNGLINAGITVGLLGPGYFAVRSILRGWRGGPRGEERRRQVGILWDLGSFWPRWFHPLAPPGYGPRAIKDLTSYLEGSPADTILAAHSQGSLISAVTIARSSRPTRFITYGSQLGILYPRMFPATGVPNLVDEVAALSTMWVNLWRPTDYIGGQFIGRAGVVDRLVGQGTGHSAYELTSDYSTTRDNVAAI